MASAIDKFPGVVLITGAGGTGIGAAVARGFALAGCTRIAITDINSDTLASTAQSISQINPKAEVLDTVGSISDETFVEKLVNGTVEKFGRLDYVVNCAGVLGDALRSSDTPISLFDRINDVNYKGSWMVSRAALAQMVKQDVLPEHPGQRGSIVNIASQLGLVGRPEADGIRVNCVCPGVIRTPMTTGTPETEERMKPAVDIAPMKRMGTPEEIANAVLFLSSSDASFVQGHALVVDGGYTIN
ncbi:hypothetical protein N0V93_008464 [Gnomoniopsis smithogilvyi]|uniref:Uncharacterized protein n=1 Tax=Gnomoniopsis smithogilvyi TaxID=1191159 RepID=A0A9W8YN85_9PEZI|nr:hypothetical protein N0V93_008464 [Gnomoniopsis smithogilvyi]